MLAAMRPQALLGGRAEQDAASSSTDEPYVVPMVGTVFSIVLAMLSLTLLSAFFGAFGF
jgi:hypothetical protein